MAKNQTGPKLEDKIVELSLLKSHPDNPNIHPVDQIDALAESMEKYGQYYRIICDEDLVILCGHGKKLALEKKGEKEAKITIISGLTDKQKKKLLLEDNKIQSLSYVNYGKIEELIKEIGDVDIIGFPTNFLESIVNEPLIDNMKVDFTQKAERKDNFTPDKENEQRSEFDLIESGMQSAQIFKCPHCGKEIAM